MDDQQTATERDLIARLRDVAQYSFDREIVERMKTAAYFQDQQRDLLGLAASEIDLLRKDQEQQRQLLALAADEIDRLRQELAK